jgi:hypothetical protein
MSVNLQLLIDTRFNVPLCDDEFSPTFAGALFIIWFDFLAIKWQPTSHAGQ